MTEAADGVVYGLDFADYLAVDRLSSHGAMAILRSPAHFRVSHEASSKTTESMQLGTAVHIGVLEPDTFTARVIAAPECDRRTNKGKAQWSEFIEASFGKVVLTAEAFDRARACVDAVLAHPAASALLVGAQTEVSLFWTDQQFHVGCKARLDAVKSGGISDLKTTGNAAAVAFARTIATFGYHRQAAFYFDGAEHALNRTPEFYCLVAVESEPPHAVAVYELGSQSILAGMNQVDEAKRRYAEALRVNAWNGYPQIITSIDVPAWALRDAY